MAPKPPSKRQHLIRQTRSTNSSDTPSISASVAMLDDVKKKFKKSKKKLKTRESLKKGDKIKGFIEDADPEEELERDSEMEPESELEIEAMPDEILLKIFKLLHLFNLGKTAQVSKRWQRLSQDESLWSKINLMSCAIESEFIEKCLKNGCKYLNLNGSHLFDRIDVPSGTKLKYLRVSGNYLEAGMSELSRSRIHDDIFDYEQGYRDNLDYDYDREIDQESYEVMNELDNHDDMVHHLMKSSNLNSLEKLSYKKVKLDLDPLVFNNCQTLTELHISAVKLDLRDMKLICNNLLELCRLTLIDCSLENDAITFLCQNLTSKIKKLFMYLNRREIEPKSTNVTPDQISALGQKCPNLEDFFLGGEKYILTESTLDAIIDNLKSLFKLRLPEYLGEYSKLLRVSTMPNLKNLNVCTSGNIINIDWEKSIDTEHSPLIRSLRKDLPQLGVNTSRLDTAFPFTTFHSTSGLWEIRCESLAEDYFISKFEHFDGLVCYW